MDIKDLKTLIKMVTETDITEFELESADEKVVIKRGAQAGAAQYVPQQPVQYAYAPQPVAAPEVKGAAAEPAQEEGEVITSPIVGTLYRAPSPEASFFVEVGQVVEKGEVLCIVEAMKLMNEIEAEFRCRILKICKENASPVEYGDPLFVVERV